MTKYAELRLRIDRGVGRGSYRIVATGPAGEALGRFKLPFSELELENFILKVGATRRGRRRIDSPEMELAKNFGTRLFGALFEGDVRELYRSSFSETRSAGQGLRVTLSLTGAPELLQVPWEYMYDHPSFLSISTWTPIVRYLDLPKPRRPLQVALPIRILAMVSSPNDAEVIDAPQERAKLEAALAPLIESGAIAIDWLAEASLRALQRQLRRGEYHVFHFIGHGGYDQDADDGVLLFEDEVGRGRRVSGIQLGTILADEVSLRLAVLNSCEGARSSLQDPFSGVATSLIEREIPAVIGMQFEITDRAAIVFASEFYAALADGLAVDSSVAEARKAIYADQNDIEWGTPVLFMRVADGRLFDVQAHEPIRSPEKLTASGLMDAPSAGEGARKPFDGGVPAADRATFAAGAAALERERAAEIERTDAERERAAGEALGAEAERQEADRVEAEEAERLEAERLEAERADAERRDAERLEAERLAQAEVAREAAEAAERERAAREAERVEAMRVEAERVEAERREAERVEAERLEAERVEAERREAERVEAEEGERLETERLEAERERATREAERVEAERAEAERLEAQRLEANRAEQARVAREAEAAERERAAAAERERVVAQAAEAAVAAERLDAEEARLAHEAAERETAERVGREATAAALASSKSGASDAATAKPEPHSADTQPAATRSAPALDTAVDNGSSGGGATVASASTGSAVPRDTPAAHEARASAGNFSVVRTGARAALGSLVGPAMTAVVATYLFNLSSDPNEVLTWLLLSTFTITTAVVLVEAFLPQLRVPSGSFYRVVGGNPWFATAIEGLIAGGTVGWLTSIAYWSEQSNTSAPESGLLHAAMMGLGFLIAEGLLHAYRVRPRTE